MEKDECKIDFKIEGMDSDGIKGTIRIRGSGCKNLTNEQLMNKIKEGR